MLPLGVRVLDKLEKLLDKHMGSLGRKDHFCCTAQLLRCIKVLPKCPYQQSLLPLCGSRVAVTNRSNPR